MTKATATTVAPRLARTVFTDRDRPEPTSKRVTITPKLAEDWLKRDEAAGIVINRDPSMVRVERYARDMTNKHWFDTGVPIIIDWDNHVRDGLQRLMAIIRSGVTLRMYVVTGIDPAAQIAIDRGRPRSNADDARMAGRPNATVLTAAASLIIRWREGKILSSHWQPTPFEVDYLIKDEPGLEEAVREGSRINRNIPKATRSVISAAIHAARLIDEKAADVFFSGLDSGADLDIDSPILALRNTIGRYGNKAPKPRQQHQLFQYVKAWNLWREGKSARTIVIPITTLSSETFPVMK